MITPAYSLTATGRVLPRMALDFTTGVLDPRVTFTRASTATFVGSNGIIQTAAINAPRFDYNPSTLAPLGLLIEEQRTNVALTSTFATLAGSAGSQYPSGTGWSNFFNTGGTRTYVASSVFAGAQAMDIVGVSAARNLIGLSFAAASSTTYTVSFYVESVSGATGTIAYTSGALGVGGTTNLLAAPTTSGRYSYTFTTGIGAGTVDLRLGIGTAGNENGSIRISNYQVEVGAFATSYIPTAASQVTRNPDIATMTGTNFSSWYTTAGNNESWFSQFISANIRAGDRLLAFDTGFAGGSAYRTPMSNAFNQLGLYDGTAERTFGAMPLVGVNKAATAYSGVTCSGTLNAAVPTSRAFDGNMNPSTVFGIGSYSAVASGFMNGWMQKVAYYPLRLSDAELRAITK